MASSSDEKSIEQKVNEFLTCSVCLEFLQYPKVLGQCLHNYCEKCLQQLMDKQQNAEPGIKCPLCDTFSSKEEICQKEFVNKLLDLESTKTSKDPPCEQCKPDKAAVATWKCQDCRIVLCDSCQELHLRIPILKGHVVEQYSQCDVRVVDELIFCSTHESTPVDLYCTQCKEIICYHCQFENHKNHMVVAGSKALDDRVIQVKENIKQLDERISDIHQNGQNIQDQVERTKAAYSQCRDEVDSLAERWIAMIKEEQKKLKYELTEKEEKQINELKENKDMVNSQEKCALNVRNFAQITLEKACNMSLLNTLLQDGMINQLERITIKQPQRKQMLFWPSIEHQKASEKTCTTGKLLGRLHYMSECNQTTEEEEETKTVLDLETKDNNTDTKYAGNEDFTYSKRFWTLFYDSDADSKLDGKQPDLRTKKRSGDKEKDADSKLDGKQPDLRTKQRNGDKKKDSDSKLDGKQPDLRTKQRSGDKEKGGSFCKIRGMEDHKIKCDATDGVWKMKTYFKPYMQKSQRAPVDPGSYNKTSH